MNLAPLKQPPPVIVPGIPVARRKPYAPGRRALTLVLGALPQETELVVRALVKGKKGKLGAFPYDEGRINGRRVIVAATGIGKTCAAMVTTAFIQRFAPSEVLMTGTASRIDPEMRNGDVIVGEVTCSHDFGSLGPNYAMEYFAAEGPLGDQMPILYPADSRLLKLAAKAIKTHVPETASHHTPSYVPLVRIGRLTAGDQFGITDERIADIRAQLKPNLMEMESGSTAQVCWYLKTPFLCVRSGSNKTQNSPDNDYRTLSPFASRQAALFTLSLLAQL